MKIRNGFVSNSSSSSFVVYYREHADSKSTSTFLLSKDKLKKLKKAGFKYSNVKNPYYVKTPIEQTGLTLKSFTKWDAIYLTYDVMCNQDDVIYFLIKNKIPFVSLCHYDEEIVVWDGKSDHFYEMPNPLETVCCDNGKVKYDVGENSQHFPVQLCPTIRKTKIDEWLKKEEQYIETKL